MFGRNRVWMAALAALVLLVVGIGVACAVWGDSEWGRHSGEVVNRTIAEDGTETIVVRDGYRGGFWFFPFGLLFFPLVILFWVAIFRALAFRGPWGGGDRGGPGSTGGGATPAWFDDWHRRAHGTDENGPSDRPGSGPTGPATP